MEVIYFWMYMFSTCIHLTQIMGHALLWSPLFQGQGLSYGWDDGLVQVINDSLDYAVQKRRKRMEVNVKVIFRCKCVSGHVFVCVPLSKKSGHLGWQNDPILYIQIAMQDTLCWPNLY